MRHNLRPYSVLAGLMLLASPVRAQATLRPLVAIGPELTETTSPAPGLSASERTTGFAPGVTFLLGLSYQPAHSRWSADLRAIRIQRSQHAADGCFDSTPDDCTLETQTTVTGLSVAGRFSPAATRWLRPYAMAGFGVYHVYHSEPTGFSGSQVLRQTGAATVPGLLGGLGLEAGRARPQAFIEFSLLQYFSTSVRPRSVPLLVGFRL